MSGCVLHLNETYGILNGLLLMKFLFVSRFQRPSDSERLLQRTLRDAEEGLELRDDMSSPPIWIDKLEEAQYTISKYETLLTMRYK